jgi:AcrR family transcriptional regulator
MMARTVGKRRAIVPKIAKEQTEENRRRIERAALELFTTQGFHGTRNREIAKKIGLSEGAIYTYFPSKEAIFASIAERYRTHMNEWLQQTTRMLRDPFSKGDLKKFVIATQAKMYAEPEYLLLILSDVVEFENRHFTEVFRDIPAQLRRLFGPSLDAVAEQPGWRGHDPGFVLASVYLYYFTYVLVERHMQGEKHLGMENDAAIEQLVDLLSRGFWSGGAPQAKRTGRRDEAALQSVRKANRERVAYLRFLSGRLWHSPPDAMPARKGEDKQTPPLVLFLPEMPRERVDPNQLKVEAAALDLFTRQGFHGTNIREIAERAGVSQGAIYTYYAGKEAIFEGLVRSYRRCISKFIERVIRSLEDPFSRDDMRLFAAGVRSAVYDDPPYWLLLYIDVIEFKNRHFATSFHNIPEQFRLLLGPIAQRVQKQPGWCGHDPGLALSFFYLYLITYFCVERLMHGNRHLGVNEDVAVERIIDLFLHGLWSTPARVAKPVPRAAARKKRSRLASPAP